MKDSLERVSKTWSREVATFLLIFTCYLAYEKGPEEASVFMWPVIVFAMPAFGFKQSAVKDLLDARGKR